MCHRYMLRILWQNYDQIDIRTLYIPHTQRARIHLHFHATLFPSRSWFVCYFATTTLFTHSQCGVVVVVLYLTHVAWVWNNILLHSIESVCAGLLLGDWVNVLAISDWLSPLLHVFVGWKRETWIQKSYSYMSVSFLDILQTRCLHTCPNWNHCGGCA